MKDFTLASRRAAACLTLVESVSRYRQAGTFKDAHRALHTLHNEFQKCSELIHSLQDTLAAQSDGPVGPLEINACTHCWSSAHETAMSISRLVLDELFYPAVCDVGDFDTGRGEWEVTPVTDSERVRRSKQLLSKAATAFSFDRAFIVGLQERIRRERAKVLATSTSLVPTTETKPKGKPGQKSTIERDIDILKEFEDGIKDGLWKKKSEYLRSRHAERWKKGSAAARSWLSNVLKRARERHRVHVKTLT